MKQILICIGLKIIEIGGFIFIPFYVGKVAYKILDRFNLDYLLDEYEGRADCWIHGLLFLIFIPLLISLICFVVLGVAIAVYNFFMFNWNWAGSF